MKAKKTLVFTNLDPTSIAEVARSEQAGDVWVSRKDVKAEVKELIRNLLRLAEDGDSLRVTVELEDMSDE